MRYEIPKPCLKPASQRHRLKLRSRAGHILRTCSCSCHGKSIIKISDCRGRTQSLISVCQWPSCDWKFEALNCMMMPTPPPTCSDATCNLFVAMQSIVTAFAQGLEVSAMAGCFPNGCSTVMDPSGPFRTELQEAIATAIAFATADVCVGMHRQPHPSTRFRIHF